MTAADHLARNAIRSAERSGRETGAALAVERCAQLNERAARSYEDDANSLAYKAKAATDPDLRRDYSRMAGESRRTAAALRSTARLMRERDVIPVGAL